MGSAVPGISSGQSLAIVDEIAATFLAVFFIPLFYHWVSDRWLKTDQQEIDAHPHLRPTHHVRTPPHHPSPPRAETPPA